MTYLTPKEAAAQLGMSVSQISRCKSAGAPVHYWGPSGTRYRIVPEELVAWMDQRGRKAANDDSQLPANNVIPITSAASLAKRRHDLIAALASGS